MKEDIMLTQTKEVVMSSEQIVTTTTQKLELVDAFGRKTLLGFHETKTVVCPGEPNGRAA